MTYPNILQPHDDNSVRFRPVEWYWITFFCCFRYANRSA
jgi:hypothetical protein